MAITIKVTDKFRERLLAACKDGLFYMTYETASPNLYRTEFLAEAELLFRLGKKEEAEKYKDVYIERLRELVELESEEYPEEEINEIIGDIDALWSELSLAA